jgi:hypothetical protein
VRHWIVADIAVSVPGLGVFFIRNNTVCAGKTADRPHIIPRVHVDETEVVVLGMAGELPVGNRLRGGGAVGAERKVAGAAAGNQAIIAVKHNAGAAQACAESAEAWSLRIRKSTRWHADDADAPLINADLPRENQ